ncbi:hypothetical protein AY599_25115 [Leptolyngbya valderiana BDU 20041]|nr:hypothetical protein AY599_25115 [Leptolyngbya valderiana BDU 20041]
MLDWFFADGAIWFAIPALFGTGLFVIQLLAGELGGDFDLDADVDLDASGAGDFRALSIQTIAAFCLGSGWMGLGAFRVLDLGMTGSVAIAVVSGVGIAWLMSWMTRQVFKMQRSGNISIASAAGLTGDVAVTVPPANAGRGAVSVVINGNRREYDAVQAGEEPIPPRTSVKIVSADDQNNTLLVERA